MTEPRWLDETQQQAWRALIAIVFRGFPQFDRTLKEHDLLVVHYSVLVALSEAPDHTMRLSELAEQANVSQSRLTHRLRVLVDRGDVELVTAPGDGRGKNATLTAAGLERVEVLAPLHVEDVLQVIFDPLDEAETQALASALTKIATPLCGSERFLKPKDA